jgi:UTP-glucose-1-phosphate uridylyltransferase
MLHFLVEKWKLEDDPSDLILIGICMLLSKIFQSLQHIKPFVREKVQLKDLLKN